MKCALLIHGYPGCEDGLRRHWPYFKKSGLDLFGIGREGHIMQWPESMVTKDIGPNGYIEGGQLPERMTHTFRWFRDDPRFANYTHAMLVEWDVVFLRPPPEITNPVCANKAGSFDHNGKGISFFHGPWTLSKLTADLFVQKADELLAKGERTGGTPDFFFGLVWDELGVTVQHLEGTFSRNSLDIEADRIMARDRIRSGECWYVHGIKSKSQLDFILS